MTVEQILAARSIPLNRICPDPFQPRRLLPPDLANALAAGGSPDDVLAELGARAKRDKWAGEQLTKLDALADSIATDGLLQPIRVIKANVSTAAASVIPPKDEDTPTVVRESEERYLIEEGERRWWAHHILVQRGRYEFQNILAFVVEAEAESSGLLRRRVAENVLRSGFTALELACAMANRIQEIIAAEPGVKRSIVEVRVGKENGMSDRRVRQFVALLTLTSDVQELAQQARLSENALRPIVSIKDPADQLAAVRELIHPSHKKTFTPHGSGANNRHKLRASSHRVSHKPKKRARDSRKALSHAEPTAPGSIVEKARSDKEKDMPQAIQQVLIMARSFKARDWSRLKATSWTQFALRETDRRALTKLRNVLARGLNHRSRELRKSR